MMLNSAFRQTREALAQDWGIVMPDSVHGFVEDAWLRNYDQFATDAQPSVVTTSNSGIPAYLVNFWDPQVIRVLQAPMAAAQINGEVRKGSWIDRTVTFTMVEGTGEVSSYGDWNNNGMTGLNVNFPQRQAYYYQTITQWGERQIETAGRARIGYVNEQNISAANNLNRFQNRTYIFGVAGLQNYGYLNDPALSAAVTPITKALGGTSWSNAAPTEVFSDIQKLYTTLVNQSGGIITMDMKFTLVVPPISNPYLFNVNSFGITGEELLKKSFPNLKVVIVPEYGVAQGLVSGNTVQMICTQLDGVDSAYAAFTEKMRAHQVVIDLSAWKQKKSQGSLGAIIRRPFAIATMIGV